MDSKLRLLQKSIDWKATQQRSGYTQTNTHVCGIYDDQMSFHTVEESEFNEMTFPDHSSFFSFPEMTHRSWKKAKFQCT